MKILIDGKRGNESEARGYPETEQKCFGVGDCFNQRGQLDVKQSRPASLIKPIIYGRAYTFVPENLASIAESLETGTRGKPLYRQHEERHCQKDEVSIQPHPDAIEGGVRRCARSLSFVVSQASISKRLSWMDTKERTRKKAL